MRIIYVDDERNALINFEYEIKFMDCIQSYKLFLNTQDAIDCVKENEIDVAFLDMEIRDRTGIELAKELREINPKIEIIYITAYSDYALEAYGTNGRAYILKPYTTEELVEVFDFLKRIFKYDKNEKPNKNIENKREIFIKTFGNFHIFINEIPLIFKNAKAKELLALLVDKRGGVISNKEIFSYLWEDRQYTPTTSTYVRRTTQALKLFLKENNCENLVSFSRNSMHLDISLYQNKVFDCDLYSVFNDELTYINDYSGFYIIQYPWSEETIYALENKIKFIKGKEN